MVQARRSVRLVGWFVLVLVGVLVVAGGVGGQTGRDEDATTNGHDLVENGNVDDAEVGLEKFGGGTTHDGGFWSNEDGVFDDDSYSITLAFHAFDNFFFDNVRILDGGNNERIAIRVEGSTYRVDYFTGTGTVSCQVDITGNVGRNLSAWVKMDEGGLTTDTVVETRVFNQTGAIGSNTCSNAGDPQGSFSELRIGWCVSGDCADSAVYEVRFFTTLESDENLDQIADPTDATATLEVDGQEEAVWFLELLPSEETQEDIIPGLVVQVDDEVNDSETFTVRVWAQDSMLDTLEVQNDPNVTLVRANDSGSLQWWNQSAGRIGQARIDHRASRVASESLAWEVTFSEVPAGEWVVSVRSRADSEQGNTVNLTASHPMTVDEASMPIEIAGLGASELIYTGVFGVFFTGAMLRGWWFTGFGALFPLPKHLLVETPFPYPFGFKWGVLAIAIGLFIDSLVRNGSSLIPEKEDAVEDEARARGGA